MHFKEVLAIAGVKGAFALRMVHSCDAVQGSRQPLSRRSLGFQPSRRATRFTAANGSGAPG